MCGPRGGGTLAAVTNPSADLTLADRFRAHGRALVDGGRSPLYAELMAAAADDLEQGGVVARLFAGLPVPLRLDPRTPAAHRPDQ